MSYKTINIRDTNGYTIGHTSTVDMYGGQELTINFYYDSTKVNEMLKWWQEWGPIFNSKDPTVLDTLKQAKVLNEVSK